MSTIKLSPNARQKSELEEFFDQKYRAANARKMQLTEELMQVESDISYYYESFINVSSGVPVSISHAPKIEPSLKEVTERASAIQAIPLTENPSTRVAPAIIREIDKNPVISPSSVLGMYMEVLRNSPIPMTGADLAAHGKKFPIFRNRSLDDIRKTVSRDINRGINAGLIISLVDPNQPFYCWQLAEWCTLENLQKFGLHLKSDSSVEKAPKEKPVKEGKGDKIRPLKDNSQTGKLIKLIETLEVPHTSEQLAELATGIYVGKSLDYIKARIPVDCSPATNAGYIYSLRKEDSKSLVTYYIYPAWCTPENLNKYGFGIKKGGIKEAQAEAARLTQATPNTYVGAIHHAEMPFTKAQLNNMNPQSDAAYAYTVLTKNNFPMPPTMIAEKMKDFKKYEQKSLDVLIKLVPSLMNQCIKKKLVKPLFSTKAGQQNRKLFQTTAWCTPSHLTTHDVAVLKKKVKTPFKSVTNNL